MGASEAAKAMRASEAIRTMEASEAIGSCAGMISGLRRCFLLLSLSSSSLSWSTWAGRLDGVWFDDIVIKCCGEADLLLLFCGQIFWRGRQHKYYMGGKSTGVVSVVTWVMVI